MAVMLEKAELVEQVEQREVTIGQLSGETETIGQSTSTLYDICYSGKDIFLYKGHLVLIPQSEGDTYCETLLKPSSVSVVQKSRIILVQVVVSDILYIPCCTAGEYVMLYQAQREALRAKFKEKDNFIQQLVSEKEAVQVVRVAPVFISQLLCHSFLSRLSCQRYRHS